MSERRVCLAVDLGAGSGRVLAGIYDGSKLGLREVTRFANEPVKLASGWHWQFDALFSEIVDGIAKAVSEYGDAVVSLGVDTWGVDYGLLDRDGALLGPPFQYRDRRTNGMEDEAFRRMPREEIYERTGIQFMFFNTIFQLLAEARSSDALLARANRLLFMPDLVHYRLTGRKAVERSIASTSQLLDASTRDWDRELIAAMGLPDGIFGELVDAGADLGGLLPGVLASTGAKSIRVIAPGCHDTASAVAGVPADGAEPVFLSSGTWSLIGRELAAPIITDAGYAAGFSNEGGVFGSTCLLKNIAGMWLLQESKRSWDSAGSAMSYGDLVTAAEAAEPFAALLDPDADDFQAPEDMPAAISDYFARTGQSAADDAGPVTRCILESLALKYRQTTDLLASVSGRPIDRMHIVGGGSQNRLLNQFAADATGCTVLAGPVEATSAGNVLLQLCALGEIASLEEGRDLIRRSFETEVFEPADTETWDAAYESFLHLQR